MGQDKEDKKQFIIEGVTETGESFRPSDWAERVSGPLATFHNHRITYSPLLKPGMKDGNKCVYVDESLKETNPEVYHQLIAFAKANKLKIGNKDEIDPNL
jgi:hypothetical protein